MIYSGREPLQAAKNQNDILSLIGPGGPVVSLPSSVVVHSDRAFSIEVEMNRPSFQFYPQDWGDDPGLQMCSLEARGLWIEMMRCMHKGEPYGYLQLNGVAVETRRLSLYVRADIETVTRALQELEDNNVFSKTDEGIIFSRRMVRDEEGRALTRKRVIKHRVRRKKCNANVTGLVTQKKRPSSSSSSSSSSPSSSSSSGSESATADSWPEWYDGITWDKSKRKVEFTGEAKAALSKHLNQLAEEESLPPMKRQELQRGWGRLSGYLLRNRQCTGQKSLPPIVVNWFENDLRDQRRIRGPTTKKQQASDVFAEALQEALEEENESEQ